MGILRISRQEIQEMAAEGVESAAILQEGFKNDEIRNLNFENFESQFALFDPLSLVLLW